MSYDQLILTVNTSSIVILLLLALILLLATRFKGENAYAAAIIVVPNVPVYLYNASRMLGWHNFTLAMLPFSFSLNTLLMPLLWLFTRKSFDSSYKFSVKDLIHIIPCIIFFIIYFTISSDDKISSIVYEMSGDDTWIGDLNTVVVLLQLLIYFPMIFIFIYKNKKRVKEKLSDAEWLQKERVPIFMILFASLFVIVMVCYAIWPRTDAWLIQILNVVAMSYLVYNSLVHPYIPTALPTQDIEKNSSTTQQPDLEVMQEICAKATDFLTNTKIYLRHDLSLALLAKEIGVSQRKLSTSINTCLKKNFFEFINEMRIEEAKRKIIELDASGYSIDSIYYECGFRSRSTFFLVFKKVTGITPSVWSLQYKKSNLSDK